MGSKHKKRGIIKQILKDHFDGYWYLNDYRIPKEIRNDILETVKKAIRCGTKDLGYAKYECLSCEGDPKPVFVLPVKVAFVMVVGRNIQMNGRKSKLNVFWMFLIATLYLLYRKKCGSSSSKIGKS